jgi:hypothetical protein
MECVDDTHSDNNNSPHAHLAQQQLPSRSPCTGGRDGTNDAPQTAPSAGAVSVELPAGVAGAVAAPVAYTVQVHTSNVRGAGTSANVTLTLRGEHGRASSPHVLENAATDFKRGAADTFTVRCSLAGCEVTQGRVSNTLDGFTLPCECLQPSYVEQRA